MRRTVAEWRIVSTRGLAATAASRSFLEDRGNASRSRARSRRTRAPTARRRFPRWTRRREPRCARSSAPPRARRRSSVMVTHDPLDAFVVGHRFAVVENGRVAQNGTGEELLSHPRTPFVAESRGPQLLLGDARRRSGLKEAHVGVSSSVLADALAGGVQPRVRTLRTSRSRRSLRPAPDQYVTDPTPSTFRAKFGRRGISRSSADRARRGVPMAADITREASRRIDLQVGTEPWAMVKATRFGSSVARSRFTVARSIRGYPSLGLDSGLPGIRSFTSRQREM